MAERGRARRSSTTSNPSAEVRELRRSLEEAQAKLDTAEQRKSRAVARATAELRKDNEMLEAQLTRLVQEIGQLRHVVDRVEQLEREARVKELRIGELQAEIERLQAAIASGRPTAVAAAAASRAASRGARARRR